MTVRICDTPRTRTGVRRSRSRRIIKGGFVSHQQDIQAVNMFKGLVIDAVHKAQSGHPGGPLSSLDLAYILYKEYLTFDPQDPKWMGRDRFILSAGHMSMLQYAMLFGTGWLTLDDLKAFRQWHSKTPGHPENFATPGVECTTGPLGQGCAMSLGFAMAAAHHGAVLGKNLFSQKTWVLCSDGDLQEGVALGSASLAGHLGLSNLIWVYDKNYVQLSGPTRKVVSDNDAQVFAGFGWHVISIDGHDHDQIRKAYQEALQQDQKPTIIIAHTVIGKGCATMEDSSKTHGSPLPPEERLKTKEKLGLPMDQDFFVDPDRIATFRSRFPQLQTKAAQWKADFAQRYKQDSSFAQEWDARFKTIKPDTMPAVPWNLKDPIATRNAFGDIIKHWAHTLKPLIGGSADLEPSNMTGAFAKAVGDFDRESRAGRNINFGVREFPMSAISNGMALFGGLVPFDATFLSFADYSRPALRLGALQKVRVIHEFTHDSFYLGEDGPTHQPIEQVMSLRMIPDLYVMRPADPQETEVLMRVAVTLDFPSAFCLTRQKVPYLDLEPQALAAAAKGAYVVWESPALVKATQTIPDLILIGTGSEVSLALAAARHLSGEGPGTLKKIRVISMPCWELFEAQPLTYRSDLLPAGTTKRVAIEAGTTLGWAKYTGSQGLVIGIDHYGASAPAEKLAEEYGFTSEKVLKRIQQYLGV